MIVNTTQQRCGKWERHYASKDCSLRRSFNCYCRVLQLKERSVYLGTTKGVMHCTLEKMEGLEGRLVEPWRMPSA